MKAILAIVVVNVTRSLCATLGLMLVGLTILMSVMLLLGSGKPGQFLKTLEQRVAGTAGLVGLSYAAADIFWRYYAGFLPSRALAIAFYAGWKILGGIFMAMLICILSPRNLRTLLWISSLTLVAFSLLIILSYSSGRLIGALIFPSLSIELMTGISVYCGVLLRRERPGEQGPYEINRQPAAIESAGEA
jgi:hypothetical protein